MRSTFSEYRIPKDFFGPLQVVDYDGIPGTDNVDDAEFKIECKERKSQRVDMQKLQKEIPEIIEYYKKQKMIDI